MNLILSKLQNIAEESFKEFKTTEFICNYLENIGVKDYHNLNPGVFGNINCGKDYTVAIRADIDALPVNEERTEFKHLCGHHAHTAILLEFLKWANSNKRSLKYNIRFIFQPAEETGKGAQFMIENGALNDVDEIYAIHVEPLLNLGEIGLKKGVLLAGAKFFEIEFLGKSTHAALPHRGTDIFVCFADFIFKIQTIISRFKNPVKSGVISIGKVFSGKAHNIIPDKIEFQGTYRFFDLDTNKLINKKLFDTLESLKSFYNIEYNINFSSETLPLINDSNIISKLEIIFNNSDFKVIKDIEPMMGSEDFAFYLEKVPGAFIRLGIKISESHPPLHNINFFVPEEVVDFGVKVWKLIVLDK